MGANPVDEHFGARIRMRRTMLSLSQRKLVSRLSAIAAILDVAPEFFLPARRPCGTQRKSKSRR
jgi:hypothetical protein